MNNKSFCLHICGNHNPNIRVGLPAQPFFQVQTCLFFNTSAPSAASCINGADLQPALLPGATLVDLYELTILCHIPHGDTLLAHSNSWHDRKVSSFIEHRDFFGCECWIIILPIAICVFAFRIKMLNDQLIF